VIEPDVYQRYVEDLIAGRKDACQHVVERLLREGVDLRPLYEDLFQASLYEVGVRWQAGLVSVAIEHRATSITEDLLALVYPRVLDRPSRHLRAVVSCAADEFHQLGGRFVADALELKGWNVHFVGAGASDADLLEALKVHRPDLLALSVSIRDHLPGAERAVGAVRAVAPRLRIIIGGQAFNPNGGPPPPPPAGAELVGSLAALDALVDAWPT
jgi:methanogenic corrinoid protein MtbC1